MNNLFPASKKVLIGMVHLLPLPGAPLFFGDFSVVIKRTVEEAKTLEEVGFNAAIIENFGDVPFAKDHIDEQTFQAISAVVNKVRANVKIPLGINVLRNDSLSALQIAHKNNCQFIRVNVLSGVMVTDQGLIEGKAYELLRLRKSLNSQVQIFADVLVKHAVPLGNPDIGQVAKDTAYRGLADALIVTGRETGGETDLKDAQKVKKAVPDRPLLIGSGINVDNVNDYLAVADGVIVGTSLKIDNKTTGSLSFEKAQKLVQAVKKFSL